MIGCGARAGVCTVKSALSDSVPPPFTPRSSPAIPGGAASTWVGASTSRVPSAPSQEVKARIAMEWDKDVTAYDHAYDHILKMSDALSDGILRPFPDRFTGSAPKTK